MHLLLFISAFGDVGNAVTDGLYSTINGWRIYEWLGVNECDCVMGPIQT